MHDHTLLNDVLDILEDEHDPLVVAEALGTLVMAGHANAASEWLHGAPVDIAEALQHALDDLDGSDLDSAADAMEDYAEESLAVRDRYEMILAGAEAILGSKPTLNDDLGSSILSFDQIVVMRSPVAWCPARTSWATTEHRSRLWWWNLGRPAEFSSSSRS